MEQQNLLHGIDYTPLSKEAEEIFHSFQTQRSYKKNATVYSQGEQADCFYYLKKGQVKIFFNSADGMEKTLSLVGAGSILGEAAFFDGKPRVSSAKAVEPSVIVSIDKAQLLNKFREKPHLAMLLLTLQAQSIRMLSAHVSSITFSQADCRIAGILLQSKNTSHGIKAVNLTHEEIGNMAGVSRVTVSKILNQFAKKGYIDTAYRSVIIKDTAALEAIASIDY
ncbi:MAG TPA: Crp/Fnr family transcriptional regulator [Clostridiales bacterium]|nr:Crp/Fnr family transcriptional regulator [Clostridiales bacterium]